MGRVWEKAQIDTTFTMIPTEEYNQLLDEWAETVYGYFCQLHNRDHALVSETLTKRTGTDG